MGYSPWGGKESDMAEATEHARMHAPSTCLMTCGRPSGLAKK